MRLGNVLVLAGLLFAVLPAGADDGVVPEGKTADYYRLLLKRPRPGYLFDRFCDSWMESNDVARLKDFLEAEEDPSARWLLAFLHERIREPAEAAELYDALIQDFPAAVELHYYKAVAEADSGWFDRAESELELLLEQDGLTRDLEIKALKLQGRCLIREERSEEGVAVWERLLEVAGPDDDVADELLELQLSEGLYEAALATCDQLLADTRDAYRKVMLRMRRASLLVRMDRRSEAVGGLIEAFKLTGQGGWLQRDVLDRIEMLYRGADDLSGMCGCYEKMLEEWPDSPVLLRAYTEALLACGKSSDALECAREVIRLVPDSRETKEWYIDLLLGLYHHEEAVKMVEGFLDRYPEDNSLRMQLAMIYHRMRERDKVQEWTLAYLEHSEKTEADYLEAARALARFGLNNEATSIFLEMLAQWPDSAEGLEAVALHMTRKSYMQLHLAWKHYERLGKTCDDETLLRLCSALMAADSPDRALTLLDLRADDFSNDFRYATARFEAIAATKEKTGLLDAGLARVDLAETLEQIETAATGFIYELHDDESKNAWVEKLTTETNLSPARRWLLAALYLRTDQPAQAVELMESALLEAPDDPQLLQCRLMLAKQMRDWAGSESVLVRLIELDAAMKSKWIRELVPVLVRMKKFDEALAWIGDWKKVSPNAIRPYELEREALMGADREEDAIAQMRRATLRFPESKELKLSLGRLYERCGRTLDAEQLYWRLLNAEESLDDRMAMLDHIIRVKRAANQMDDLIRELQRRSDTARTAAFPLLGLAECYRINYRMNERSEVLNRVLELRPNDVTVLHAKASLEEDLGNYDAVRSLMLRIADEDTSGHAYRRLVEFEYMYGDPAAAGEMLADPRIAGNVNEFLELALRLVEQGSSAGFLPLLEQMAVQHPGDYRFDFLRGVMLQKQNEPEAACHIFMALQALETERPGYVEQTNAPSAVYAQGAVYAQYAAQAKQWSEMYCNAVSDELLDMYRMASSQSAMQYQSVPSAVFLKLPDNLEQLHLLCRQSLIEAVRDLPAELRDAVEQEVPFAQMCWINSSVQFNSVEWWSALEHAYPDDEEIRRLRLLVAASGIEDEAVFTETLSSIVQDYPELTLGIIIQSGGRFPSVYEQLPALVERSGVDEDNAQKLSQVSFAAASKLARTNAAYASVAALVDKVEAYWNEHEADQDAWTRFQLALARAELDQDFSGLVACMEDEFLHPSNPYSPHMSTSRSSFGTVSYYYNLNRITFPPAELPDASLQNIQSQFSALNLEREEVKQAILEYDEDALFRWLLMAQLGFEPEQLELVQQKIEAKENKTRNDLFALACWYGSHAQLEQSLDCVLELRERSSDDRTMRSSMDRLLINLYADMDALPENFSAQLAELVPELKKTLWGDHSSRILLVDLIEQLDLPMEDYIKPGAAVKNSGMSVGYSVSSRRSADVYSQITEQIQQGETESALLRVAVMLRSEALKSIHGLSRQQQYNHYMDNCLQYLRNQRLEDQFLALFIPPEDNASPRQLYEYAYALDGMNRSDESLELYEKVCEARPDWIGAKVRYCSGLMRHDVDKALPLLEDFPSGQFETLLQSLQQGWNNNRMTYLERLSMMEMMITLLEREETLRLSQPYRLQNLQNWMVNRWL